MAKAVRIMWLVSVLAFCSHLSLSSPMVAVEAHILGIVLLICVGAFECWNRFALRLWIVLERDLVQVVNIIRIWLQNLNSVCVLVIHSNIHIWMQLIFIKSRVSEDAWDADSHGRSINAWLWINFCLFIHKVLDLSWCLGRDTMIKYWILFCLIIICLNIRRNLMIVLGLEIFYLHVLAHYGH